MEVPESEMGTVSSIAVSIYKDDSEKSHEHDILGINKKPLTPQDSIRLATG